MSYHMSALLSLDQRAKEVTLCKRDKPPTAHGSAKIILAHYNLNIKKKSSNIERTQMAERIDTGIRKRGNSYQFRVFRGYRADGTQIEKLRTWHAPADVTSPSKADKLAKAAYAEFVHTCTGNADLKENMRFSELAEWYMQNYACNLKPQTFSGYEQKLNTYLLPEFGTRKLKDFSPALFTEFYKTVSGIRKTSLSLGTIKTFHKILNSIFSVAVKQGFIPSNPCKNAILPSMPSDNKKRYYMTPEETQLFLSMTKESTQENTIYKLLLYTGMRIGECLALSWSDINFSSGFISIHHNLVYADHKYIIGTPKSASGTRTIALSDTVRDLLLEQKKRAKERVRILGDKIVNANMVFISEKGNYVSRNYISNRFHMLVAKTPLNFMTIHMLRHSNASLLINAGVDIKIVSEHLGHADIDTTADIYVDIFASTKKATATLIDDALSGKNNGQTTVKSNIVPFRKIK